MQRGLCQHGASRDKQRRLVSVANSAVVATRSSEWRAVIPCLAIALVLIAEWRAALVTTVEAETFGEYAVEIERSGTWRYGYVLQRHGALLVKSRLGVGTPPLEPLDSSDEVAPVMVRTLRLIQWKAAFELSFYGLLWVIWDAGVTWWRRRYSSADASRWRRAAAFGALWAVIVTAVLAPYLLLGYGDPLLSNWCGPGAMSYTTHLGSTPGPLAPALTYRAVVLLVLLFPLVGLGWACQLFAPIGEPASFWIVSVVFYGLQAATWQWAVGSPDIPPTNTQTG